MRQDKKIALNPYLPLTVCIADGEPHYLTFHGEGNAVLHNIKFL